MNTDEHRYFDSLTERVLGAVFEVANTLGAGFLEKVYERALLRELVLRGVQAATQASFAIDYKGQYVGEYFADILVENVLVVEIEVCISPTNISRNVSTICEPLAGPFAFWSISRNPKLSGGASSRGTRCPIWLRRLRHCPRRARQLGLSIYFSALH
jgi:GxxExxY protein